MPCITQQTVVGNSYERRTSLSKINISLKIKALCQGRHFSDGHLCKIHFKSHSKSLDTSPLFKSVPVMDLNKNQQFNQIKIEFLQKIHLEYTIH